MWIKDSKGEASVTTTVLMITLAIASLKLILAGIVIKSFKFGDFTASDFSIMLASASAFYYSRRNVFVGQDNQAQKQVDPEK